MLGETRALGSDRDSLVSLGEAVHLVAITNVCGFGFKLQISWERHWPTPMAIQAVVASRTSCVRFG